VAYFMCKRSFTGPAKKPMKKFTVKDIEPFIVFHHRRCALRGAVFVAVLGVAIQKLDGRWGLHELWDETSAEGSRHVRSLSDVTEQMKNSVAVEMKKKLVDSLNRLRENHERLYIYASGT
jgi:hypothetical protein